MVQQLIETFRSCVILYFVILVEEKNRQTSIFNLSYICIASMLNKVTTQISHIGPEDIILICLWQLRCIKMNIVTLDPGTSLPSYEPALLAFPFVPHWPVCQPAWLAALHFTLICECEFYQTSIFSFESHPDGHFIVLQARNKHSVESCAFPCIARAHLIPHQFFKIEKASSLGHDETICE